ncbi:MAG: hypothetical protein NVV70_13590 [Cellulomonas sp.]|nr:hypothetical protein [Cellulomonas sp.]MCR6649109.1 hypothetical protein [Cellulomonas sp.]
MRNSSAVAVAATVLVLAACATGMSGAEAEACDRVSVWAYGGQDTDRFDQAVAAAQEALSEAGDTPLDEPLAQLVGSPEAARGTGAEAFLAVCEDHGWEPLEG